MVTDCVGVVLYFEDKVLLVKHTQKARLPIGSYGFPAGRVENDETFEAAAVRELFEETGLITEEKYLRKLPVEKRSKLQMQNGTEEFIFQPFLCIQYSGELKLSEKTVPEFVELNKVGNLFLVSDDVKEISLKFKPKVIEKKLWPDYFESDRMAFVDIKCADFELNDGDQIKFREWDPDKNEYTGREYIRTVKRVTKQESPTRYWKPEHLERHGMYIIEWE